MSDDLVKRLRDLHKQATTERNHYYVARSVLDAIEYIEAAEAKLAKAVVGLRQCEAEIDDYIRHEYPGDHPVHARYRKRYFDTNPARNTIAELKGEKNE